MIGAGKYDELATIVRTRVRAEGIVLILLDGPHGSGFAVQVPSPEDALKLATVMRVAADEMEADAHKAGAGPKGKLPVDIVTPAVPDGLAACMSADAGTGLLTIQFGKPIPALAMDLETARAFHRRLGQCVAGLAAAGN